MFIEWYWLILIAVLIGYASYKPGYKMGHLSGYDKYDKEIDAMQRKGEVTFPSLKGDEE